MKHVPIASRTCLSQSLITLLAVGTLAMPLAANEDMVVGWISTDRTIVAPNSTVTIDWAARYPRTITDFVSLPIAPSATIVPKISTVAEVRVIGAAFGPSERPFPVQGWIRTPSAGASWTQIFLGNQDTVNPQEIVWSGVINPGEPLDFQFRGAIDNMYTLQFPSTITNWVEPIDTTSSSPRPYNRFVFRNGDTVPNFQGAFDQRDVHSHLRQYFEEGTNRLRLGQRDFIYLTELSPFDEGNPNADLQDLVLLVTFSDVEEN